MLDHAPSPETLGKIGSALGRLDLSLLGDEAELLRLGARRLVTEYLTPRLEEPDGALVVAVVGASGSGKSTLVNSLAHARVSHDGTLRPTTIEPVAWAGHDLPCTLDALRHRLPGRLVDTLRPPPDGIVIVDTPPPGVVDDHGESVAAQVIAVADACIHVAAGGRYGDASGFELAEMADRRGLPIVFVLNRISEEHAGLVAADYAEKLAGRGLLDRAGPEGVVTILDGPVDPAAGAVAAEAVAGLAKEIDALSGIESRAAVISRVVDRSLTLLEGSLSRLRGRLIDAETLRSSLLDPVAIAYGAAATSLRRDLMAGRFAGAGTKGDDFADALVAAAARHAGRAAREVAERWSEVAPDRVDDALFGHGAGLPHAARERIEWWSDDIVRLAEELSGRRIRKRRSRLLIDAVRQIVVDRRHSPGRRPARWLKKMPMLVATARNRLVEELAGIVEADSRRFLERVGPGVPDGVLVALSAEETR